MTRLDELVPADRIAGFASRWQIIELSLFGSVLRDDFVAAAPADQAIRSTLPQVVKRLQQQLRSLARDVEFHTT